MIIQTYNAAQLATLEQRFRTTFINSLSGFKSLSLIGTLNAGGQTNLAIFNSVVHLGANPAMMGFIVRPDSVDRHTLVNIRETGFFTINHVQAPFYAQAHQTSARYPEDVSEFDATGLTPEFRDTFPAPFVHESTIQCGLQLSEIIPVSANGTYFVTGTIQTVSVPADCLCDDGYLDIEKAGTLAGTSLDGYHSTARLERLSYAKTDRIPTPISFNYRL